MGQTGSDTAQGSSDGCESQSYVFSRSVKWKSQLDARRCTRSAVSLLVSFCCKLQNKLETQRNRPYNLPHVHVTEHTTKVGHFLMSRRNG